MANIPLERTETGTPWWVWLLGLLVLVGLVWFLIEAFGDGEDDEIVAEDPVEAVTPGPALDLSDVYVTRVVGDNTFFVSPTEGGSDETLVYLEEEPTPGQAIEGRYDVTEGQHLSINGEMMDVGGTDVTAWGLTADQAALVGDEYIRATSLTVLNSEIVDGEMSEGEMSDGETLGLAALTGDLSRYDGRRIDADGVRVTALAGDSTFYVGDGNERTLVVLESLGEGQTGPGDGSDGAFDVNVGDVVSIDGEVMAYRRSMRGTMGLSDTDAAAAEAKRYVIVVDERGEFSKQ